MERLLDVTQQPLPRTLVQQVALECLDARGRSVELPAHLAYDPADPWAVEMTFSNRTGEVRWLVGRDLLIDGLTQPTGEGDVLLWPSIDEDGCATVVLELCSPHGRLVAQLASRELGAFLCRTLALVPRGAEIIDLEELVAELAERA